MPGEQKARAPEITAVVLIGLAVLVVQLLIGGTRLLFSYPGYVVLAVAALLTLLTLRRAQPSPSQLCFAASAIFFGYILTRALLSPVPYLARSDIYSVIAGLIVYFIFATVLTSAPLRVGFFFALLVFALAHVLVGLIQFRYGNNFMPFSFLQRFDYGHRASGFYVCPDHLAGFLEVAGVMGVSLVCWGRSPVWAKLLLAYAVAVCYAGLLLTGSRGGFLAVGASLGVFAILSGMVLRQRGSGIFWRATGGALVAALALGALIAFLFHANEHLAERTHILDYKNVRLLLWKAALQQWRLNPLFGTGSGTYLYYGRIFRTEGVELDPIYVHNDYLHLLAEYGIAGAALFLSFLGVHLWNGWRNFQRLGPKRAALSPRLPSNTMALQIGALGAVAAYMVHSVVDFNLHIPANVLLMAVVFALLANAGQPHGEQELVRFSSWRLLAPALAIVLAVQSLRFLPGEYFAERARVSWNKDKPAEAIAYAERALKFEKQNPDLYDYLGSSRSDLADTIKDPKQRDALYLAALLAFEHGRALAPLDKLFPLELAFTYDSLGRFPEAEWMFAEARRLDPKSTSTQGYYEGHLMQWSGRTPEVEKAK
ncbi:MAG: hypothetical protein DLM52_01915 [Chthoniobacterales bacterium]|nr:MAG: hypothetical protein DLM52_01915 [Chthoniobacterales bacterium]